MDAYFTGYNVQKYPTKDTVLDHPSVYARIQSKVYRTDML